MPDTQDHVWMACCYACGEPEPIDFMEVCQVCSRLVCHRCRPHANESPILCADCAKETTP